MLSHPNVFDDCLKVLERKGYHLRLEPGGFDENDMRIVGEPEIWVAERDGFTLQAYNPAELLGLAGVYEHVRPKEETSYWWNIEGPSVRQRLEDAAYPEDD